MTNQIIHTTLATQNHSIYEGKRIIYVEKHIKGVFLLFLLNSRDIPKACFLYFDTTTNSITNHQLHIGKSYYKAFTNFIIETLIKTTISQNIVVIAPKYYINPTLIRKCKELFDVTLEPYNREDIMFPTEELQKKLKSNKDLNVNTFESVIKNFNSELKVVTHNKGLTSKKILNINKKSYSTLAHKKELKYELIKNAFGWHSFTYDTYPLMSTETIETCLSTFWEEVIKIKLKDNLKLKISLQFRVQFADGNVRSISYIDTVTINDREIVIEIYRDLWGFSSRHYQGLDVKAIIIFFKIYPENHKRNIVTTLTDREKRLYSPTQVHKQIPNTMDFKKWGDVTHDRVSNMYNIAIKNSKLIAKVIPKFGENFVMVTIKDISSERIIRQFTDKLTRTKNLDTFKRMLSNMTIWYVKGVQKFYTQHLKVQFIKKLVNKRELKLNIITMDLETCIKDNKMVPVLFSIYIGKTVNSEALIKSFPIWDYDSPDEMIIAGFRSVLTSKYNDYSIYFHNFANFDSLFIMKPLMSIPNIKVNIKNRDGVLLQINVQYSNLDIPHISKGEYNYSVNIYDSLLLLPQSLDKLGKTFASSDGSSNELKGFFPLKILNDHSISFDYEGDVPPLKYFYHPDPLNKIKEYEKYKERYNEFAQSYKVSKEKWILKIELIKYCEQDVITLYNVVSIFSQNIYNQFKINVLKYPTLPSVAFAIFRSLYMLKENIPILSGSVYEDHRQAYYGGFVDVYKAFAKHVRSFDVNSLYPFSMWNYPMPIGEPTYFEGDPTAYIKKLFGFVFVEVTSPNKRTPILPHRKVINGVLTTIYPTGTWSGWYFTEEIKNAEKYGYKFEIFKGYHYEKSILFKKYVSDLYKIKCSSQPGTSMYIIAKLLLNSLYGRFGMSPYLEENVVIDASTFDEFKLEIEPQYIITDKRDIGDKCWISYKSKSNESADAPNVSVPIAASITAWSRINMSKYIMDNSEDICAIDTDGIKLTKDLNPKYVGTELGKMKDEGTFKEAVFIAPKVYGGITESNDMIIKVKGLKESISYWQLKTLLYVDNVKISQSKWYKNFSEATINVLDQIYTLRATENKRELIKDSVGKIIDTRPYQLLNGELVKRDKFILYYLNAPISPLYLNSPVQYQALPAPITYPAIQAPIIYPAIQAPIIYPAISAPTNYLTLPAPTNI